MIAPRNLLIVRTDRIGDVILSLPLAEMIKKYYPYCKVSILVREYVSQLVLNHPFIDGILLLKENNKVSLNDNIDMLKSYGFDTSIIVYPTFHLALITFLSGIKNRIGTGYRWYSFLFNNKIYEHRKYAEKHELEYNIGLLKAIGIEEKVSPDNLWFHLGVSDEDKKSVKHLLENVGVKNDTKFVIIHPGSGGSSVDLPVEKMIHLTDLLSREKSVKVVITGNESETELCSKFEINNSVINLAGKLNLSQLKTLISLSELFISNSTGPLHIAAALGVYVIGFYPKILSCSVERWGPYTQKRTIFSPSIDCDNCSRKQCEELKCMNSIDIGKVFEHVKKVLKIS
jgi:ADP-heptose:LPS heptosyltransferase